MQEYSSLILVTSNTNEGRLLSCNVAPREEAEAGGQITRSGRDLLGAGSWHECGRPCASVADRVIVIGTGSSMGSNKPVHATRPTADGW